MEFRDKNLLDMGSLWPGYDDDPGRPVLAEYAIPETFDYLAQTAVARAMKELNSQLQAKVDMVCHLSDIYSVQFSLKYKSPNAT